MLGSGGMYPLAPMPPNLVLESTGRCGPSSCCNAPSCGLVPPGPTPRGGSGFGAGTIFRFWPCAQCAVGRSERFGDTAERDGYDTVGAPVCADTAVAVAITKIKAAQTLIIFRGRIEFSPHSLPGGPGCSHRLRLCFTWQQVLQ